ncbi:hypothetical protein B7486_58530, partial [cyanobacterium TDX16]
MRLHELASVPGTVVLCGLGVEVDAFVRRAPSSLGPVSWDHLVVVERRPLVPTVLADLAGAFGVPVAQAATVPDEVAAIVR